LKDSGSMNLTGYLVLLATFVSGMLAAIVLSDGPAAVVLDAESYWQFGQSVAAGDVFMQTHLIAYRTPGYPWFVAFCQIIAGPRALATLIAFQGAMCALLVPLGAWIASRIASPSHRDIAAITTAILTMVGISRLYFARAVLGESLFVFVMMLHIACVVGLVTGHAKLRWGLAAGLFLGLTILIRPIGQWLWVAHILLIAPLVLSRHWSNAALIRSFIVMGLVTVVVISPWWVRNAKMFGRPFLTEFVGRNIWIVTFQDQAGAGLALPETPEANRLRDTVQQFEPTANLVNTWEVSNGLTRSGMADDEVDRLMRTVAVQATRKDIGVWTEKYGRRLVNFFRCISDAPPTYTNDTDLPDGQWIWRAPNGFESFIRGVRFSPHLLANMIISSALACAWLGLISSRRDRVTALWLGAMIGYFALVTSAIEIPAYRYRLVVEPLMAIMGGCAIATFCSRVAISRQTAVAADASAKN